MNQYTFTAAKIYPTREQANELRVFNHHIYEYKKGLRNLILTTEKESNKDIIINRLEKEKEYIREGAKNNIYESNIKDLDYLIQNVTDDKINVFFGNPDSVAVIRSFNESRLNKYTPEQDFILGTLLGYDKVQESRRYLNLKQAEQANKKALKINSMPKKIDYDG